LGKLEPFEQRNQVDMARCFIHGIAASEEKKSEHKEEEYEAEK
jgi:hypothetical protein